MEERFCWNYNFMRHEVSQKMDELIAKGWVALSPTGHYFTDQYYIDQKKLRESKKIQNKLNERKYIFITLQDFQRRLSDLDKIKLFIKRIAYMYDAGFYVVEAGSSDPPNVHIHLLVKIKLSCRNHKQVLCAKWAGLFDTDLNDKDYYQIKQWRKSAAMPDYNDWLQEKKDYFCNEKKSSHSNSIDLKINGTFGDPS